MFCNTCSAGDPQIRDHTRVRAGYSLTEGLVAVIVIGMVLVGAASFFAVSRAMIVRGGIRRQATERLTEHVENIIHLGYDALADGVTATSLGQRAATITTEVENVASSPGGAGYRQVTATISWTIGSRPQQVRVVTFISSEIGGH